MPIVHYEKIMTENRTFSWKLSIFGNFGPLVVNHDIKIFEKVFDFLKPISPISKVNFWLSRHITIPILSFSLHLSLVSNVPLHPH